MESALQALIAVSVSFIFATLLCALVVLLCRRRSKSHSSTTTLPTRFPARPRHTTRPPPAAPCPDESASFDPSLHISMSDLRSATGNFSPDLVVGDGSFGLVYKARLPTGDAVAVKKLSADAFHGFREFRAEMETLGRIRHANLARILGYCVSGYDRILVYEFLERGCLDQWLHEAAMENRSPLPWSTRLRVIRGVAAGLTFLHDECKPCIIHRDIKASNVLLDSDFEARICDFGLARRVDASRSHVSTTVAGTMGYMPPEYRDGLMVATVKADVYSFGILMLEVATGRRPNLPVEGGGRRMGLIQWVRLMVEKERWSEILDEAMREEEEGKVVEMKEVTGYMTVALQCAAEVPKQRPYMAEVVSTLNNL